MEMREWFRQGLAMCEALDKGEEKLAEQRSRSNQLDQEIQQKDHELQQKNRALVEMNGKVAQVQANLSEYEKRAEEARMAAIGEEARLNQAKAQLAALQDHLVRH